MRMGVLGLAAIVCVTALGCDRIAIERLGAVGEVDRDAGVAMSIHFRQRYFDTLSQEGGSLDLSGADFVWAGGELALDRVDGTRVSLSEVGFPFAVTRFRLRPEGERLRLELDYAPVYPRPDDEPNDPEEVVRSLRFVDPGGNIGICRVSVDYEPRTLELELTPVAPDGRPTFEVAAIDESLARAEGIEWMAAEPCPEDLDALDWASFGTQADALLAQTVTEELVPQLVAWLDTELSLPGGGIRARALRLGVFEPVTLDLLFRTPSDPALERGLVGSGDGFSVSLVPDFRRILEARCVDGLAIDVPDPPSLARLEAPATTPAGEAYAAAVAFDRRYLESALGQLVLAGQLCVDIRTNSAGALPPLSLFVPGIDQVNRSTGFNFGEEGQVRLQPLAPVRFQVVSETGGRWTFERARLEVYADTDDVLVRVAEVIGTFTIDTELRISDQGALVAETASVDVAIEAQDLALLQRVGLEPDAELLVSTALESLVERLVSLQLSKPFGLGLQLKAFDVDADVVWVFVDLLP